MVMCYRGKVPNTSKMVCGPTACHPPQVPGHARKRAETQEARKILES